MTAPPITGEAQFPGDPSAPRQARSFLRVELDRMDVGEATIETTLLLASELVTNAVLHARTDLRVRYLVEPACLRVEVLDGNSRMPAAVAAPLDATSGRGLALVQSLANTWGIDTTDEGKAVWFEIPMSTVDV